MHLFDDKMLHKSLCSAVDPRRSHAGDHVQIHGASRLPRAHRCEQPCPEDLKKKKTGLRFKISSNNCALALPGANLDDEVSTAIKRAGLLNNVTLMTTGFDRLWYEIRVVQPTDPACINPPPGTEGCLTDGIQADSSFHQHGPELLDGSYGEGFVTAAMTFLALAQGTGFGPSAAQADLFVSLLLDGMRWMTIGSPAKWDWSVKGRDMGTVARSVQFNASSFHVLPTGRSTELAAFGAAIDGEKGAAAALEQGHRAYWTSDYSVIHSHGGTEGCFLKQNPISIESNVPITPDLILEFCN
jgi:hypothetical protein